MKNDLNKILTAFNYKQIGDSAKPELGEHTILAGWKSAINHRIILLAQKNKVPDVTGLGLKDAVYLLENIGLKVISNRKRKSSLSITGTKHRF